ncbi:MAG: hypothetical protein AB1324_06680 [Candidatus Micrarchaeota archaeon]
MANPLPELFQRSKRSEYRKSVASVAILPSERETRRAEFSRIAYSRLNDINDMGRGLVVDLPKLHAALMEMGAEIESKMRDDPYYSDLLFGNRPFPGREDFMERWLSSSEQHGFIFLPNRGLNCGMLLSCAEVLGQKNYLSALMANESVGTSARMDGLGVNIIDLSAMLEDAVFKINAFRFGELEPVASMLLNESEIRGPYEAAKSAFARRHGMLSGSSGMPDAEGISKVIDELAADRSEYGVGLAAARVNLAVWSSLSMRKDSNPDLLVHTSSYLGSLVANAFISYGLCGFLKGSAGGRKLLGTPHSAALCALAAVSFGEPYDKLAAVTSGNLGGRPDHVLNSYLVRLNYALGYQRGQGQKKANVFIMTRSESAIRDAAFGLLQDELNALAGRALDDRQASAFAEAGSMKCISGEQFQRAAGVWVSGRGGE